MPEPQPGTDRPADGSTPVTGRDPGTEEPTHSPAPPVTRPIADDPPAMPAAIEPPPAVVEPPAGDASTEPPVTAARGAAPVRPTGTAAVPVRPTGSAPIPVRPTGQARVPGRPDPAPARLEAPTDPPAPRASGSASVPPPPPLKRAWGESAEPTPVASVDPPEHAVPVDPWEDAETTGWDLRSVDFRAMPPTTPYPTPPRTRSYPTPPVSPAPQATPTPRVTYISPVTPTPPPASPTPPLNPTLRAAPPVVSRPVPPTPTPVSPPAPVRPSNQRRQPAPPGWQAPKGYVAVPVRRRRRWPWVLLFSIVCCCGVPLWWALPLADQYPANATLPERIGALKLRDDARSQAVAEELKSEVRQAHLLAEDTFAGIYTTTDGGQVALFGGTGFRLDPESDAEAEITRLTDRYALNAAVLVRTTVRGRYERCAVGRAGGNAVVVCTSVDHGSLATGVFTRLSVDDSARLLDELRRQVVTADQS